IVTHTLPWNSRLSTLVHTAPTCSAAYLIATKNTSSYCGANGMAANTILSTFVAEGGFERAFVVSSSERRAGTKPSRVTTPLQGRFLLGLGITMNAPSAFTAS